MTSSNDALNPDRRGGLTYLRLVLLGGAIGIPAALLATFFLTVVHWLEHWLWVEAPHLLGLESPPWYLIVGLPMIGAVVVALARKLLPGNGGHLPLEGIRGGATPVRYAPGIALAALGTLAFGAVLGPEAPLIALGAVVGVALVPLVKADKDQEYALATAGSFSAISALFGGPLVAGMLLLEGGLAAGSALLPVLIPGLAAAAVGYVLFVGLGGWAGLTPATLAVPDLPQYDTTRVLDLVLAVAVGIVAALLMAVVKRFAESIDKVATANPRNGWITLVAGGAAIGLLALIGQALGADYEQILFSGQSGIPATLEETSIITLLVIIAAKSIAYGISLGAGFRGGAVFPAIFLGTSLSMVAALLTGTSVTWALAVGAAAGMTAGTGMVFSSLMFAGLLSGTPGLDVLPAATIAVLAAWLTNAALKRRAERNRPPAPETPPTPATEAAA